jgi:hypothetical protein
VVTGVNLAVLGGEHDAAEDLAGFHLLVGSDGCSRGSTSCTTARNSPRLAAANISAVAARRSAAGTVSVLNVANDIDFWNAANIGMAKSGGG